MLPDWMQHRSCDLAGSYATDDGSQIEVWAVAADGASDRIWYREWPCPDATIAATGGVSRWPVHEGRHSRFALCP